MHETKKCARCNSQFECNPDNIVQCQCYEVRLTNEQRAYIDQRYQDCLCKNCLVYLSVELNFFKEKYIFR